MERFVQTIERDIKEEKLLPNTFLPSLAKMTEIYQLSINSLQKGLDILEAEELIERIPRKGIRIKPNHKYTQTTIRFGYYANLTYIIHLRELVNQFETMFPQIKVELIPLQYENYKDVIDHYFSANMLDLVTITEINFHQMTVEEGKDHLFLPVEKTSSIYSQLYDAYQYENNYYVTPLVFSPVILCYQTDFFTDEELEELQQIITWEQFNEFVVTVKNNASYSYPFYFKVTANNRWPLFFLQSGIDFSELKSNPEYWPKEKLVDALRLSYQVIHQSDLLEVQMLSDELNVEDLFKDGDIPMMLTTYYGLNDLRNSDISYEVKQLPFVNQAATILLSTGIAMNANIHNQKTAECFIQFLISNHTQQFIREKTTVIPSVKKIAEQKINNPQINEPRNYSVFKDAMEEMVLLKDLQLTQTERIQLLNYLKLYWMNLRDEEETLTSIQKIYKKG